ncbi:sce7726 family protein [Desulfitobacterium sp. AusDCA]|uniref:sce7726 family protein n=1 Tax=Desulfitobacterium sp. AusDCA TaxID=3240383 RepID=UPI003DA70728
MDTDNSVLLNRVFTRNTIREILEDNFSDAYATAIRRYIVDSAGKNNGQLISEIYAVLKKEYRNEYYYKNTILNKLLLGVHKPTTTTALTEITIGKSKADFVLINGRAVVYEIKTELDNLDRLESQIANYFKAFTRVSVLTCEDHFDVLQKRLDGSPVGICILTKKDTIREKKKPQEYFANLNLDTMFRILRKQEYEEIIERHFGALPNVSQFEYYRTCKKMFCSIEKSIAYTAFVNILKKRVRINVEMYNQIPYELKFLVYFSDFKADDYLRLHAFLHHKEAQICTSLI